MTTSTRSMGKCILNVWHKEFSMFYVLFCNIRFNWLKWSKTRWLMRKAESDFCDKMLYSGLNLWTHTDRNLNLWTHTDRKFRIQFWMFGQNQFVYWWSILVKRGENIFMLKLKDDLRWLTLKDHFPPSNILKVEALTLKDHFPPSNILKVEANLFTMFID
jgi:hypothetical protein